VRTRVKICGITRLEDGLAAIEAGADALGFVFYDKSPRKVTPEQAVAIALKLPPFVTLVGLFVNPSEAEVRKVLNVVPLGLLQFHGDESPDFCEQFRWPYLKALRMRDGVPQVADLLHGQYARGVLLDAWDEKLYGGTGKTFDWHTIQGLYRNIPVVLAGGLTPANVAQAIQIAKPWAVDVSSGVESAPGVKDKSKIEQFISEVQRV
jgi:phosphoribosylanthranilate isomerase